MKKLFAILFVLFLSLAMVACDNNNNPGDDDLGDNPDGQNPGDPLEEDDITNYYKIVSEVTEQAVEGTKEVTSRYIQTWITQLDISEEKMQEIVDDIIEKVTNKEDFDADRLYLMLNDNKTIAVDKNHTLGLVIAEIDDSQPTSTNGEHITKQVSFYEKDFTTKPSQTEYNIYADFMKTRSEYADRYFTDADYYRLTSIFNNFDVLENEVETAVTKVQDWLDDKDASDEMFQ
jgi:hypothetical protein